MRVAPVIELTPSERKKLQSYSRSRSVSIKLKERSKIILLASDGLQNWQIAEQTGQDVTKVGRWRRRYAQHGLAGIIKDKTRPGRIKAIPEEKRSIIISMTIEEKPKGATHWSRASMSKAAGVSPSTVGRIWKSNGLKPHLHQTFKVSNDRNFEQKLNDIVGLYLNPPENALVFSCDEKSQIQALDRTQPGLPLKRGKAETFTHDYKRNGTTSLFAALNTITGQVVGTCMNKHRHQEWIKFLNLIKSTVAKDKEVHIICDNYATHKHEKVTNWLKRNKRFHVHFTPTSASWLNMVERFFRDLTDKSIRRGVFKSVEDLIAAIQTHIAVHNESPKPFIWTAKASDILEKVTRAKAKINKMQSVG